RYEVQVLKLTRVVGDVRGGRGAWALEYDAMFGAEATGYVADFLPCATERRKLRAALRDVAHDQYARAAAVRRRFFRGEQRQRRRIRDDRVVDPVMWRRRRNDEGLRIHGV